jgi:hypothetical protein
MQNKIHLLLLNQIFIHDKRHPQEMSAAEAFLTYLAVDEHMCRLRRSLTKTFNLMAVT